MIAGGSTEILKNRIAEAILSDDSPRDRQNRPHKNAMTVDHAKRLSRLITSL